MSLADRDCVPCRGDVPRLLPAEIEPLLVELPGWEIVDGHHLSREFAFDDYAAGVDFVNSVARVADEQGHHPDMHVSWGHVTVDVWTHAIDGLTESDFILAAKVDHQFHPEPRARVRVWQADDPAHAHLLAGLLDANGIDAEVRGEAIFSGEGGILPSEAGPTVWVFADDRKKARDLLDRHHDDGPSA